MQTKLQASEVSYVDLARKFADAANRQIPIDPVEIVFMADDDSVVLSLDARTVKIRDARSTLTVEVTFGRTEYDHETALMGWKDSRIVLHGRTDPIVDVIDAIEECTNCIGYVRFEYLFKRLTSQRSPSSERAKEWGLVA